MAKLFTVSQAGREAIIDEMHRDPNVFIMGQDVQVGLYANSYGLVDIFGPERVRNTPISEAAYTGAGVGAAMVGMRPIVDWGLADFMFVAMDQLISMAAKTTYLYGGQYKVPVVFLATNNAGGGACSAAQHSNRSHPMLMNNPGLKIIAPTNPVDMYGLMKSAIRDDDPVVCFRECMMDSIKMELPDDKDFLIPIGKADVKREGTDVTIVGFLHSVNIALQAAKILEKEGISVEVVDPRTIKPLDRNTIFKSIRKTGRLVCVDVACKTCSGASEVAALAASECFDSLKAPVGIVTAPDVHFPFSPGLEALMLPTPESIATAVRATLK